MTSFKMAYLNTSVLSIVAWVFLVTPVLYGFFVLLTAGDFLDLDEMIHIGVAIAVSIISVYVFKAIANKTLSKRESVIEDIYDNWAEKAGITVIKSSSGKYEQAVNRSVRAEWIKQSAKYQRIIIDGNHPMDAKDSSQYLEYLNRVKPKTKQFVIDSSGTSETIAHLVDNDDDQIQVLSTKLNILHELTPVLPDAANPNIEFSETFTSSKSTLDYLLVTRLSRRISPREYKAIESKMSQIIPAIKGYAWRVSEISNTAIMLQQSHEEDLRYNQKIINLIGKSATVALKVAPSYATAYNVEIFAVDGETPTDFDIVLRNHDDLNDEDTLQSVVQGFIRVAKSQFNGEWEAINLLDNDRLGFIKIG